MVKGKHPSTGEWLRYPEAELKSRKLRKKLGLPPVKIRWFLRGEVRAQITYPYDAEDRYRMSISTATRYPTWDEVADARYDLIPADVVMAMPLPPPQDYLNEAAFTFNLIEVRGIEMLFDRGVNQPRTHERQGRWPDPGMLARAKMTQEITDGG